MKITAFLYLLMRDSLPTGQVAKLIHEAEGLAGITPQYSAPELAALAERYAKRLA